MIVSQCPKPHFRSHYDPQVFRRTSIRRGIWNTAQVNHLPCSASYLAPGINSPCVWNVITFGHLPSKVSWFRPLLASHVV